MAISKSYLFVTFDGGGNIPPVLGLAQSLAKNGHKVSVLTEPCLEKPVKSLGLYFIPFLEHYTRMDRKEDICKDWNASPFKQPVFENIFFGPAKILVRETMRALKDNPADVLLVDCMLPPALIVGEILNIPRVVLFHMPEYLPGPNRPPGVLGLLPGKGLLGRFRDRFLKRLFHKTLNKYLPGINNIRASYQLKPLVNLADILDQADRRYIQTAKAFDFPIEPAPFNVRYTGPVLDDPDWVSSWKNPLGESDNRPLILVSLSSTFQNQSIQIQRIVDAMGNLEVRGLVTLGLALEDEVFKVPENVKVIGSAPHSEVLPLADLVITHAGHGTVMRTLANGLPMICMPMGRDQNDNAAKVVFHGCGIKLSNKATTSQIQRAIENILINAKYKEQALKMKIEINMAANIKNAVLDLENLALMK